MKCEICENKILIGSLVHEVPNRFDEQVIVCDDCYNLISFYL